MTKEEVKKDPFAGVVWNYERIRSWDDPSLNADTITRILIGGEWPCGYWMDPEYDVIRAAHPHSVDRQRLEIEIKILRDAGRARWYGKSRHGKAYFEHMLTLITLMSPEIDITPSLADMVMLFCMGFRYGRKILNAIGCQNSGKSRGSIYIAFAVMLIDPEYSEVFVANPFDNAADSTVWGDVEEVWSQIKEAFPNDTGLGNTDASSLFPYAKLHLDKSTGLELIPRLPKAGSIRLRNTKDVGKFKGSKARGGRANIHRGVMLLIVDEVNEIKSLAFLQTLTNITSQDSFFGITSQNFKDPEDMGGQLTTPKNLYGGPGAFEELNIDEDIFWHSQAASMTLRFDGHKSPNILAGRVIYERLFKETNREHLRENYGEQSPEYMSQARSFPAQGDLTNAVLTRPQVNSSRYDDDTYALKELITKVSFCDPAFGGRDKAVYGFGEVWKAIVTNGDGMQEEIEILLFKEGFHALKLIDHGNEFNDYWRERMNSAGVDTHMFTEGAPVTFEEQIVLQCVEYNRKNHVPHNNFGYDFSLRPDIVNAVNRMMGFGAVAFDYNQGPEGIHINRFNQSSEDLCKNRVSELAFLTSDIFISKQVRGGKWIGTAIDQTRKTRYETVNKKKVVEGKPEYKARWNNISPDHRDVLFGIAGMAVRRGFRRSQQVARKSESRRPGGSIFDKLSSRLNHRGRVFKRS